MNGLPDRMQDKIRHDGACWTWIGAVSTNGYGQVFYAGRPRRPHRVAYEILKGPIPDGLTIDHLCKNKLCVNPDHLEAVTGAVNIRRHADEVVACPRGHGYDATNTYIDRRGFRDCKTCKRDRNRRSAARLKAAS